MYNEEKPLMLFSLDANIPLAKKIAESLGIELSKCSVRKFSDGEVSINIDDSVRGSEVFVIQSTSNPVNESLMTLLIMIDALKRASVDTINVVIPYYGYARQDRKARSREPITAKLVANLLETAGADRIVALDLHALQIQGFFDIPVDHLMAVPIIAKYFKEKLPNLDDVVIVSPDHGGVTRARKLADRLNAPIAIIDKRRPKPNVAEVMNIVGNVEGKICILIDDIIDTAGTITLAAKALMKMGAKEVYASCSHAVLSGPAIERIEESPIKELVYANTIDIPEEKKLDKMKPLCVGDLIGQAIYRIHNNEPVSVLFE